MDTTTSFPPATRALIDLAAFRHNLDAVRSYTGPSVKILAVVKANAYGHGARRVASEAVRWGVDYLGVARIHEAMELRMAGVTHPILVFEVAPAGQAEGAIDQDIDLTVATLEGARVLQDAASRLGKKANVHAKIDTGMGRLGFPHELAAGEVEAIARTSSLVLVGVYSHFATSEDPDRSFAALQLDRFGGVCQELSRRGIEVPLKHMANSGAIIAHPDSHFNMVRPGIMLYGYPPADGMAERFPVHPVMELVSRVAFVKSVEPGTSISYGRRYVARSRTRIATVPAGYADGYPRLLTGRGEALIRGRRYPVVGTICMDQLMIDVGDAQDVAEGDVVTLLGKDGNEAITAWDIGSKIGSIPYEITCLITQRVPRMFLR
jgi:alanine racemase